jgi:hypothetical protein
VADAYETAARAHEVLALDIDELDLRNRCAKGRRKGNAVDVIVRQTGTAPAAAWAAQGPPDRPGVCNRPARPHRAATRRPRPGHRPRTAVAPPRRRAVRAGHRRLSRRTMDAAPASALGAHPRPPGRRQHRHAACLPGHTSVASLDRDARVSRGAGPPAATRPTPTTALILAATLRLGPRSQATGPTRSAPNQLSNPGGLLRASKSPTPRG